MNILFLGFKDDANVCNRTARAINAHGGEMRARVITVKPLHLMAYAEDINVGTVANCCTDETREIVKAADWIVETPDFRRNTFAKLVSAYTSEGWIQGDCRFAAHHGRTAYREDFVDARSRDEHDSFGPRRRHLERWFMSWSLLRLVTDAPQACVHTQPPPYILDEPPPVGDGPLRVLHAPSHRSTKNTELVERVLRALADVELEVASGYPNADILDRMRKAHVYADQFDPRYGGGLGAAAHEALANGLPLVSNAQNICWAVKRWYWRLPPIWHVWGEATLRATVKALRGKMLEPERSRALEWAKTFLTPAFVYKHWWRALNFEDR